MSFMYNPFPYDDPRPVNTPALSDETAGSVVFGGSIKSAAAFAKKLSATLEASPDRNVIVAFDGYTAASWDRFLNLLHQQLFLLGIDMSVKRFSDVYKTEEQIHAILDPYLEWDTRKDPTLLFGRLFKGGYEAIFDKAKVEAFRKEMEKSRTATGKGKVIAVCGFGSLVLSMRDLYDIRCYFDITPKECTLRIRRGEFANYGDRLPLPANLVIRRCYYADYEMAVHLRKELLQNNLIDYYFDANCNGDIKMLPGTSLSEILSSLSKYPFRCKPVYLEGVWGGTYMKKLRELPDAMRNAAWVFDLIPMEVSVLVKVGNGQLDIPFSTFFMKEGDAVMGPSVVKKYGGYFPIRFNYDDSYHSTGNMSIQVHSGAKFNIAQYDEFGRQDESYYVVVAGHHAKTFLGFRDDADVDQFVKDIQAADTQHVPVDYMKYVSYEDSKPGLQVMIPAGTIHSSGRNQVVLEIGSLTIGSYTYKMYDYLRLDFDGKQRPIHTQLGAQTIVRDRRTSWVRGHIVQEPRIAAQGEGWTEYIVGECDLLYFSLRRLEFERQCFGDTEGKKFHVLSLVDGEHIRIRSVEHPERFYDAEYMDIVVVPADMGRYVIENLGKEPICVHKTMLKDGYEADINR